MNMNLNGHLRVQPGPANYWSYPGAISQLESMFTPEVLSRSICIAGARAHLAAHLYLPKVLQAASARFIPFSGHCTKTLVENLANQLDPADRIVIGIGGGSALDTAKALAARLNISFIAIPTIAATCAAFTPLSVWYSEEGRAIGYENFTRAADAVLVEPRIIAQAPVAYLRAGIADTLAKWYEAELLCQQGYTLPLTATLGLDIAKNIRDILINKGAYALAANRIGEANENFVAIVDTIIAGGGLVGGLGGPYTRVAAAHAIHNGLSVLPETARHLHGTKVAYGILVQSALQGKLNELRMLIQLFREIGLPTGLADLGIDPLDAPRINTFVHASLATHESIHLLPFPVTPASLTNAVTLLENCSGSKTN